ncbi:MAG: biosynthetic-type acetolactate synthase large subunit [Actinomycetota bacterium]|nr:MAG: acetolactate synthase I/II/III large [Actinomycetota bacterium]MDO8949179.1 biosynthetic-type acetolactate synthase large subunit [Actinomycetota bacterium]MDP3631428.1 biosynthetic-type acetolactate synthase large subunit [Actinomycetota bacterium]
MRMSGAQALVKSLQNEGVEVVFGYPGGVALPIFDALFEVESPRTILVRHEQAAVHAADGYARVTGKPCAVIVTSGPGATNTITGIANAFMDSIPLVVFTAQVATHVIGTDAFQESDMTGITIPITKHNYLVKRTEDLPEVIKEAYHIASTGRPGPVLIDVPVDVSKGEIDYVYPENVNLPGYKPTFKGHTKQIKQAAALIAKARKPLLYAGGGVLASGAWKELKELAELMQLPIVTTLMGKGAFPEDHHLYIGMPGMHGAKYTNYSITETDLLIAVGVRFDDRVTGKLATFASKSKVIHIDIDPAEIGKNKAPDVPIVGDAAHVLSAIVSELRKMSAEPRTDAWMRVIDDWRARYPLHYHNPDGVLMPQYVVERIRELTKDRPTVITTEVGQNQMWSCQYTHIREPRTWVSSGGLGTMGFGLPAAMGAQLGRPEHLVIDIAGDGSIQMNIQELATAKINHIPVKIVILNNGVLGMVHQWQELFYGGRFASSILDQDVPDFVKLAEAYGCLGLRVRTPEELDAALLQAFEYDGPVIVDCRVPATENVYPMVAPGGSIDEMLGGIPGGPVSEMLDDDSLLEEVWE